MRSLRNVMVVVAAVGLALGCGDTDDGGGTTQGGELAGRWVGTSSDGTNAEVTISSSSLSVITDDSTLTAVSTRSGSFSLTLQTSKSRRAQATQQTAGSGLGFLPLPLGGTWTIGSPDGDPGLGCTSSLAGSQLSASCREIDHLPDWLDEDTFENGSVQGVRVEELSSSFGALSGRWTVTPSGGGSCELRFEGTTFQATCQGTDEFEGTFSVTVAQDVISGSISDGIDFSATRR